MGVFYLIHSLLASDSLNRYIKISILTYCRLFCNLFPIDTACGLVDLSEPLWLFHSLSFLGTIALCLLLSSLVIILPSFCRYNISEFIGISFLKNQASPDSKYATLQMKGMNKYIRHPLYAGLYLLTIGALLLFLTL